MFVTFVLTQECMELAKTSDGHDFGEFLLEDPVELDVEVNVSGGQEAKLDGPPENCQPGYGPDVELVEAILRGDMTLLNTEGIALVYPEGYNITKRLSAAAVARIEQGVEIPAPRRGYRMAA